MVGNDGVHSSIVLIIEKQKTIHGKMWWWFIRVTREGFIQHKEWVEEERKTTRRFRKRTRSEGKLWLGFREKPRVNTSLFVSGGLCLVLLLSTCVSVWYSGSSSWGGEGWCYYFLPSVAGIGNRLYWLQLLTSDITSHRVLSSQSSLSDCCKCSSYLSAKIALNSSRTPFSDCWRSCRILAASDSNYDFQSEEMKRRKNDHVKNGRKRIIMLLWKKENERKGGIKEFLSSQFSRYSHDFISWRTI